MSADPAPALPPRRNLTRVFVIAGIAVVVLCGIALLPQPARNMGLLMTAPVAAIFLPTILFSAAKLRCPVCAKPLPLAFEGNACPACKAPIAPLVSKPSAPPRPPHV